MAGKSEWKQPYAGYDPGKGYGKGKDAPNTWKKRPKKQSERNKADSP